MSFLWQIVVVNLLLVSPQNVYSTQGTNFFTCCKYFKCLQLVKQFFIIFRTITTQSKKELAIKICEAYPVLKWDKMDRPAEVSYQMLQ